jgi:hypothetical protein
MAAQNPKIDIDMLSLYIGHMPVYNGVHLFLYEHVFLSHFPLQLHLVILSREAGAVTCSILCGFKILQYWVLQNSQPHSVASMLWPSHACTWRWTRWLWNLAASDVAGSRSEDR